MSQETEKPKLTKEEISNWYKDYYNWLKSIYPLESFEIQGKNGEILSFYHGFNMKFEDDREAKHLSYFLRDNQYQEAYGKEKEQNLLGEERDGESANHTFKPKAFIGIDIKEKWFNFAVEWDYHGKGYGKANYDNYLTILDMLGIEDRDQYEIRVYSNPNHDFFKRIHTKELVAKTNSEPNTENALQILEEFAKHPNSMRFNELNTIVQYAINSNVPMEQIAKSINDNGFNIFYSTVNSVPHFEEEDFEKFKSFGITGLKATCMHHHFMRGKNFGFMQLLGDVDMKDATLEFRRIFEEVKKDYEKRKAEGGYISSNLEQFGELEHIILDWAYSGLLFKSVSPEIKTLVKKQAISKFDQFDPEHKDSWNYRMDSNSVKTLRMLRDAGLMNKDTYIELYQKALNRNYNLEEFDNVAHLFIDGEERKLAREEISQNAYYPSPKGNWQRSRSWGENHKISKVTIPQRVAKKGKVRDTLKQEILRQGTAKRTKIKTDMAGVGKDGNPFVVDNLKDWLFGVPGTHGNLQMMGTTAVTLPPQTPKFVVDLIEQVFKDIEYPDFGER